MFKQLFAAGAILMSASFSVNASQSANYGWEDGVGTVLGSFGSGMQYTNTGALANSGTRSLLVEDIDSSTSGTPQGYLAWITGLTDGDTIDASFWAFDNTSGASPSVRIWGHYTDDINDVDSYAGSAGGNNTYSGASVWSQLSHQWTFDSNGGQRNGLVVEVRYYDGSSAPTGSVLIDDLVVSTSSDTAVINFAGATAPVPVPAAVWLFGSALMGLVGIRRRA